MGILIGKVAHETMIVVDASPLPVEGTETRVNAQVSQHHSPHSSPYLNIFHISRVLSILANVPHVSTDGNWAFSYKTIA